jgi:hypothetical protein
MSDIKVCTYLEHDILINEYSGSFRADGIDESYNTLNEIKEKIDKESKVKFKPISGFILNGGKVSDVLITRPHTSTYNSNIKSFWVLHKDKKKRETSNYVILDTESNRKLLAIYMEKFNARTELEKECKAINDEMKAVKIELEKL